MLKHAVGVTDIGCQGGIIPETMSLSAGNVRHRDAAHLKTLTGYNMHRSMGARVAA